VAIKQITAWYLGFGRVWSEKISMVESFKCDPSAKQDAIACPDLAISMASPQA
jgi:hypothetical protein